MFKLLLSSPYFQVDIFNGLNNDLLAREGLVAIDMKHSVSPGPVSVTPVGTPLSHSSIRESMSVTPGPITHIKQDMMYPASMGSPAPPNSRQVLQPFTTSFTAKDSTRCWFISAFRCSHIVYVKISTRIM